MSTRNVSIEPEELHTGVRENFVLYKKGGLYEDTKQFSFFNHGAILYAVSMTLRHCIL